MRPLAGLQMMTGDLNTLCPNVLAPAKAVHVSSIQLLSQDYIEVIEARGAGRMLVWAMCETLRDDTFF